MKLKIKYYGGTNYGLCVNAQQALRTIRGDLKTYGGKRVFIYSIEHCKRGKAATEYPGVYEDAGRLVRFAPRDMGKAIELVHDIKEGDPKAGIRVQRYLLQLDIDDKDMSSDAPKADVEIC